MGPLGYLDGNIMAGILWNRVPFPRLIIPSGNDGLFLEPTAFNSMRPMEFVVDRYASLHATYHMKGLIFNAIPLVRFLKLREVVGFNILYGSLSAKNTPIETEEGLGIRENAGLYKLPEGTTPLGSTPYMEWSVGLENIMKIIRIDYVRRLTYCKGMSNRQRGSIRLEIKIAL